MRRTVLSILISALALLPAADPALAQPASGGSEPRAGHVRTVSYPGLGAVVTLEHLDRIANTPQAFQAFVERRLTRLWQTSDPQDSCRPAATMIVKKWRSDGFALISDMGNFAPCPDGGWVQIAVRQDGRWRTPVRLAAQEPFRCKVLKSFAVPVAVVPDGQCIAGQALVSYRAQPVSGNFTPVLAWQR